MHDLTRIFRSRSLQGAGMLLAVAGLAAAGLENVSFGHEHVADGHAAHHRHLYLGSHEHHDADHHHDHDHEAADGHHHGEPADHDHDAPAEHDHGAPSDHDHEAPVPHRDEAPVRTATVSVAPALFQPVGLVVLPAPLENLSTLILPFAVPRVVQPVAQPALPRGPPSPSPLLIL